MNAEAVAYLHEKFPGIDDEVFCTDYSGEIFNEVIEAKAVCQAALIEKICAECEGVCSLPEAFKNRNSKPVVRIQENHRGVQFLDVRWTCGIKCKYNEFKRMFTKSGLTSEQLSMTFENYFYTNNPELRMAKIEAFSAAEEQKCLIIAGKRGTGKTHLATAIAIDAMKHKRQAIFRLVNAMLDELREAAQNNGDYFGLMRMFKEVPCLILDDLGKEKNTQAGMDYLHQIVDYRYLHNLQTIATTNALNSDELSILSGVDFVTPIISRLLKQGRWITIANAEDFRTKKGAKK